MSTNSVLKRDNNEARERSPERSFVSPEVNIFESKDGYLLEADLPGVSKDGLEITLEGTTLTLVGRRHAERVPAEILYRETNTADFRKVFELDPTIDTGKIHARMDQGVLFLDLPKAEKVKPRRISIGD